jgi:hypothetical protein
VTVLLTGQRSCGVMVTEALSPAGTTPLAGLAAPQSPVYALAEKLTDQLTDTLLPVLSRSNEKNAKPVLQSPAAAFGLTVNTTTGGLVGTGVTLGVGAGVAVGFGVEVDGGTVFVGAGVTGALGFGVDVGGATVLVGSDLVGPGELDVTAGPPDGLASGAVGPPPEPLATG